MTISHVRDLASAALIALIGVIAVPAAVVLLTEEADAVLVVLPHHGFLQNIPEGAGLLEWNGWTAVIGGGGEGLARKAYAAGATLVLPIRKSTCLDLRRE